MSKMKPWLIVLALLLVISASCVRIIQSDGSGINEPTKAVTAIDVSAPTTQKQVPVATTQKQVPVTTEIAHTTIPGDPGSPEQTSIEIIDITGKPIFKKERISEVTDIDLSNNIK